MFPFLTTPLSKIFSFFQVFNTTRLYNNLQILEITRQNRAESPELVIGVAESVAEILIGAKHTKSNFCVKFQFF
ncbi:hypothetical protein S83_045570 [Arachis hypogaea]